MSLDKYVQIRLSTEDKEKLKAAAAARNMTVSEFIRFACNKIFNKEDK